jgi:hypothetical protein
LSYLEECWRDVLQSLAHLEYSYKKTRNLSNKLDSLREEELEAWEAFCSRFSRASDLFMAKYMRAWVLNEEGAFRGSMRDLCDIAEKLGLIDSATVWMEIRELRNRVAHEYINTKLEQVFEDTRKLAPTLLKLREKPCQSA